MVDLGMDLTVTDFKVNNLETSGNNLYTIFHTTDVFITWILSKAMSIDL
jgi:hypothetical protein